MTIQINGKRIQVIPDSDVVILIVFTKTVKNLKLEIISIKYKELNAFKNPLQVMRQTVVELTIENIWMPIDLLVVNSDQKTILLSMNWFENYDVNLDVSTREIMFVIG